MTKHLTIFGTIFIFGLFFIPAVGIFCDALVRACHELSLSQACAVEAQFAAMEHFNEGQLQRLTSPRE